MPPLDFSCSVRCASLTLVSVVACAVPASTHSTHVEGSPTDLSGAVRVDAPAVADLRTRLAEVLAWAEADESAKIKLERYSRFVSVLRAAGDSRDDEYRHALKLIAEATSERKDCVSIPLEAMDALYRLGEPLAYFQHHATHSFERPYLSYQAMLICGRVPDAERTNAFFRAAQRARDAGIPQAAFLESAARQARSVEFAQVHLQGLQSLADRVESLGVSSLGLPPPADDYPAAYFEHTGTRCDPLTAWARNQLAELSSQAPVEVAQALLVTDLEGHVENCSDAKVAEQILNGARDWLSQFLAPESRAIYVRDRPLKVTQQR